MRRGIAAAMLLDVAEKSKQSPDLDPLVSEQIIRAIEAKRDAGHKDWKGPAAIARLFEVAQPSVTAWFQKRRISQKNGEKADELLGTNFTGKAKGSPEAYEWGMRWRALQQLLSDGFPLPVAFTAITDEQFDRSQGSLGWGDMYASAKAALENKGDGIDPPDIPRGKGLPKKRR